MSEHSYICVVDDDPDIREVVRLVLEARGYRVTEAADGAEALARLHEEPDCCVILLDLMMPGMNGWEFRAHQRTEPALASIPVVVLSGVRELTEQAKTIEADAYLQKPVDLDRLLDTIDQHC
jgi:CheY-like chemotaxis protein